MESVAGSEPVLFLRTDGLSAASNRVFDLHFVPGDGHGLWLNEPRGFGPVVELPPVHVRVDPHSVMGNRYETRSRPGMLFVSGTDTLVASTWRGGTAIIGVNLVTGSAEQSLPVGEWLAFSRWSLVIDDGDAETVLARFESA